MSFVLHPTLAADTLLIGDLPLCRLLLMNDAQFPWCILVPRREEITEIHQLGRADQHQLLDESSRLCEVMIDLCPGKTMNVAALGNVVSQLHVHHIVRQLDDVCWPRPVWGQQPSVAYAPDAARGMCEAISTELDDLLIRV